MKKRLLPIGTGLLVLLLTLNAHAQLSVGLSGGYTRNYLYTNIGYRLFTQYQPADGFSLSLPVQYAVTDWLALQADVQLVQKNYRLTRSDYFEGIYNVTTNQYLQLPVMGHFSFGGRKLKGFLNLGGYAGYWATSTNKGVTPALNEGGGDARIFLDAVEGISYNESYTFDSRKDRRLELGWLTGVGVSYQQARYNFFLEGRYSQSLLDQQKKYMINQVPCYNQTYTVQVGCLYQLTRHR